MYLYTLSIKDSIFIAANYQSYFEEPLFTNVKQYALTVKVLGLDVQFSGHIFIYTLSLEKGST